MQQSTTNTNEFVLKLKFLSEDLGRVVTVRQFFKTLLLTLWNEKEGFSGKRPFGNSDWESDLIKMLIDECIISGCTDEYGYIEDYDSLEANERVKQLIEEIFKEV